MKVLVVNAGSSSLKFQLMDPETAEVMAKGLCERIGIDGSMTFEAHGEKIKEEIAMPTHVEAMTAVLETLTGPKGVIESMDEIDAVGHRVVHGGEIYTESVLIDDEVKEAIKKCSPLSPLHNPANLMGIEACEKAMPGKPMVAVFDTAFHQTMPAKAFMYALPYDCYEKYSVRRYGFHGTSHRYVSQIAAETVGKPIEDLKIVTCHLGNGSSITAVDGGKSVDTSMGLTPLAGVPMGTRCGDIDPAILRYLHQQNPDLDFDDLDRIMNKESGVYGISGVSSDFRDLDKAIEEGNERARLAVDMFCYQVKKYIGAYAAAMGGVDVIVFTAGVGENGSNIREQVLEGLEFLGLNLDEEKNKERGKVNIISTPDSKVKVVVVPTDEELVIAQDTRALAKDLI